MERGNGVGGRSGWRRNCGRGVLYERKKIFFSFFSFFRLIYLIFRLFIVFTELANFFCSIPFLSPHLVLPLQIYSRDLAFPPSYVDSY